MEESKQAVSGIDRGNRLNDETTLQNLQAWTSNPFAKVGNNASPLTATPAGLDSAGMSGCKSQTYTTWNCTSRGYIGVVTGWSNSKTELYPCAIEPSSRLQTH